MSQETIRALRLSVCGLAFAVKGFLLPGLRIRSLSEIMLDSQKICSGRQSKLGHLADQVNGQFIRRKQTLCRKCA